MINNILFSHTNGNASVTIYENGTREIEYDDKNSLLLEYPLNIDIRVSSKCKWGYSTRFERSVCSFCHESARTDGSECDYNELMTHLAPLPHGIELAIGANEITEGFEQFLELCKNKFWIPNITINSYQINHDHLKLSKLLERDLIYGLGISHRKNAKPIPEQFLQYNNTVIHVIAGIDDIDDIITLSKKGVRKLLILGEKDFGFNEGRVDLKSENHKKWYRRVRYLFNHFEIVSFDNLALEQLNIQRFFDESSWNTFHQGEYSFYINAVGGYYSPSSRSEEKMNWNDTDILTYFRSLNKDV